MLPTESFQQKITAYVALAFARPMLEYILVIAVANNAVSLQSRTDLSTVFSLFLPIKLNQLQLLEFFRDVRPPVGQTPNKTMIYWHKSKAVCCSIILMVMNEITYITLLYIMRVPLHHKIKGCNFG